MKSCILTCLTLAVVLAACGEKRVSDLTKENIIPKPVSVTASGDFFKFNEKTIICYQDGPEVKEIAEYFAERLRPSTGFKLELAAADKVPSAGVYFSLSVDTSLKNAESYEIAITKKLLQIKAATAAGLFRGVQTLRQILPPAAEMASKQEGTWEIATGTITDYPEYAYRGVMLDVARHFFGPADVKNLIDEISYYKINFLHLHLADDQGWRIEIKSWPRLAEYGGSIQVGGGKGGYYTREDYSAIVKYAAERYITIVPEIDMPGHTNAALASYPELNCNGKAPELYSGTEVGFSTLCAKKEITYKFIDDVVREISEITPGPYFHIGGDESHSTKREDYIPFISRVLGIVASHGKQAIGWDDISISDLPSKTIAQHWANAENARVAVSKGASLILSPAKKTYLDMQYTKASKPGLHWAAYIEVDSAYMWNPETLIPGTLKENILGIEAPLWTETISNMDEIEYMVFPRLAAIAETGWTSNSGKNWEDFRNRLASHGERLTAMGIEYYRSELIPWK